MERIFARLEQINVNEEQLPVNIQKMIDNLDNETIEFQQEFDKLAEEGKNEEEISDILGEKDADLDEAEENIIEHINDWYEAQKVVNASAQVNQPQQAQYQAKVEKEEKSSGGGMLIFGIFALVVTLGAVNVLKNR